MLRQIFYDLFYDLFYDPFYDLGLFQKCYLYSTGILLNNRIRQRQRTKRNSQIIWSDPLEITKNIILLQRF